MLLKNLLGNTTVKQKSLKRVALKSAKFQKEDNKKNVTI